MGRLPERSDTYLTTVRGMCRTCRTVVPARVALRDGGVWQQALCPHHSNQPALVCASAEAWYAGRAAMPADRAPLPGAQAPQRGCPHDCGPCTWHASPCQLPVVSITNQCQLRCPICFTWNRRNPAWHMPAAELRALVAGLVESTGGVDLIDLTGGEPTLHPDLPAILDACRHPGIGRIALNSNGLRLAEDPALCAELARREVCVILSWHADDEATSRRMHGAELVAVKRRALANLAAAGCRYVLLTALCRGVNEGVVAGCLDRLAGDPWMRGWCVQTMTYTGQGGGCFDDGGGRRHLPVDEAAALVCRHSAGRLVASDFAPRPSAHPLCYRTAFLLREGGRLAPLARLAEPARIAGLLTDSYLPRLDRDPGFVRDLANEAAARGADPADLAALRALISDCHPPRPVTEAERQRRAEERVRSIYIHSHMDEDTFDAGRAMCCPDQVPVAPGRLVPACTYNLVHRMADPRFYGEDG
jgi:uncharacterized radical SAM superfamily Fe-S cluster-containing enzyme